MCRERGATLVEILVALALVALAFGSLYAIYAQSSRTDAVQEKQQAYQSLVARLEERVRRDLRSAVSVESKVDGGAELRTLEDGAGGEAVEQIVTYRKAGAGTVVERQAGEAVDTFDFTNLLDGRELVFKIQK